MSNIPVYRSVVSSARFSQAGQTQPLYPYGVRFTGQNNASMTAGVFNTPYSQAFPPFTDPFKTTNPQLTSISSRRSPNFITPFQSVLNDPLSELNFNKPFQQLVKPTLFDAQIGLVNNATTSAQALRQAFPSVFNLSGLNPYQDPTGKLGGLIPYITPDNKAGINLGALDYLNFAERFQANVYPDFRIGIFNHPYTGGV